MVRSWFSGLSRFRLRGTIAVLLSTLVFGLPLPALALEDLDLPDDVGLPSRRQAGGTRGPCVADPTAQLTPLLPQLNVGRTLSSSPTLFVYLPKHTTDRAMLIVQELDRQKVWEAGLTLNELSDRTKDRFLKAEFESEIALSGEAGVASISMGDYPQLPELEPGKIYLWAFQFICANTFSDYTQGWIEVISSNDDRTKVQGELEQAKSDRDRIKIYAEQGIWYDLMAMVAQMRQMPGLDSDRAIEDWKSILRHPQVGLENIAEEPLLPSCCTSPEASVPSSPSSE
ncbi:DUF928 domain-containing protein [Roseofilum casamattae]|uniref:DUF928 domain-containing protein n=1 Tax=Roseofilum casamattae BLCC-M143 TaxID=3022442 RepID=A0ABT7BSY5_9CYAN|nr:DUF928 domain-containing protein [Roseofilum casamattae]MDJ1182294.1 DUF928 domain-containing protein [Roseofilum casamattae BLCC-M143]